LYEVVTHTIVKIAPALAQGLAPACSLQHKDDDHSLFVVLAWCEAIGLPHKADQ
jgi:hypothetical protein